MKQTTTTLNGHTIHMVEVPGKSYCHEYWMNPEKRKPELTWLERGANGKSIYSLGLALAPGNWKPLGLASDIPEEIAEGLAEFSEFALDDGDHEGPYMCHLRGYWHYDEALPSLHSFVKSHHFNPETTFILIKE